MSLIALDHEPRRPLPRVTHNARGPMLAGIAIIAVFFGGMGGWAAYAPLSGAALASGVVKVEANRQAVQHLDGGIVRQLLVREGDRVKAGQVLLRLDDTLQKANLDVLLSQRDALKALESRLLAERDGAKKIEFEPSLQERQFEPAIAGMMAAQTTLFEARRRAIGGQLLLLRQRIAQLEEQMGGYRGQIASLDRQRALIAEEAKGTRELNEKGYAPKTKVLALDRSTAQLDGQKAELTANTAKAKQAIGEAELQILQLEKDRQAEVAEQLRDTQTKLFDVEPRVRAAQDTLDRLDLKAPQSGYVVGLNTFTVGGVIQPRDRVLDIVPEGSPLVVEAQIRPEDVDDIQIGKRAVIHLTAFKQRVVPVVHGDVTSVSADRFTDQRTGAGYYTMQVVIDPAELADLKRNLQPGMPAEVMVPTRERTALDYLLQPLTAGFEKAFREK